MLSPDAENETTWVIQAQSGDRSAYAELVRLHHPGVIRVIHRLCGDADLAQDAAQDAFIQAWLHLADFRPGTSLRSWLYRIAVNAALDALRREARISPADLETLALMDGQPGPETALYQKERTTMVQQAILALSEAGRSALVLREYGGLTYEEIATALNIPLGTVMSRLNYARRQLKQALLPHFMEMEMEHA